MEEGLELLEEVEEAAPAELPADPDVSRSLEPHPLRRLGSFAPPHPSGERLHLPLQYPPHLGVDPGLLDGIEGLQVAQHRELLEPGEVVHQLAVEDHEGLLQRIPLL